MKGFVMATYECSKCGMGVNATCAKCDAQLVDDNLKFFVMDNAATQTVTIPANSVEAFRIGAEMEFIREGAGAVTFAVSGLAVLESRDDLVDINAQYSAASLKKIATDEWRLIGDLA